MVWAVANSNLALVKYWGKADPAAHHPASGSISVTLDGLSTAASVSFEPGLAEDEIDGLPVGPAARVGDFVAGFRARFGIDRHARVSVASNFPVAAGLASSASTFAALAKASLAAAGIESGDAELASLARSGSGSACRSIFGGFVEWRPEEGGSTVVPLAAKEHWPLAILVAVTSEQPKAVGSREGMARTAATSPYYRAWLEASAADLGAVRAAIRARNLARLGPVAERNCLRMHAAAMAADPPILYWEPATVAVMRRVFDLRRSGVEAYFSIDAGPQVKVLCEADAASRVQAALAEAPGVIRVLGSRPGDAAMIVAEPPLWVRRGAPESRRAAS